jgi:Concanavalin A-like lectin/glucanases superfamily
MNNEIDAARISKRDFAPKHLSLVLAARGRKTQSRVVFTKVVLAVLALCALLWSTCLTVSAAKPVDVKRDDAKNEKNETNPSSKHYALSFDGVDDFVELPTLKYDSSHPITIELRAKSAGHKEYQQLVLASNFDYLNNQDYGICLFQRGDVYPKPTYASWAMSYAANNNRSQSLIASEKQWKKDRESHIAFIADGPRFQFYIDGKLWRHGELGDAPAASKQPFMIGGHRTLKGYFQGTVDEIRFSKVARYAKNFTPAKRFEPDKDTMALYHCDEGNGKALTDSSGNNRNGKISGATWVRTE